MIKRKDLFFQFSDKADGEGITCSIQEVLDETFGFYIWPSSYVLASYIHNHRYLIKDKIVLELGAGTSLSSVLCGYSGAKSVILTDREGETRVFENMRNIIELNSSIKNVLKIRELSWGEFAPYFFDIDVPDLILGADIFYDVDYFEDVIVTCCYFFDINPNCKLITAYQERQSDMKASLNYLVKKYGLTINFLDIPENSFCEQIDSNNENLDSILLFKIEKKI